MSASQDRHDSRLRILLADSHRGAARQERWAHYGFHAVVAHDAMEALERFRDDEPGLVLIDDGLEGFELSGLVRILRSSARGPPVRVLLITHGDEGAEEADAVGADGFIRAPPQRGRLPEAVERALAMNHHWSPT